MLATNVEMRIDEKVTRWVFTLNLIKFKQTHRRINIVSCIDKTNSTFQWRKHVSSCITDVWSILQWFSRTKETRRRIAHAFCNRMKISTCLARAKGDIFSWPLKECCLQHSSINWLLTMPVARAICSMNEAALRDGHSQWSRKIIFNVTSRGRFRNMIAKRYSCSLLDRFIMETEKRTKWEWVAMSW